MNKLLLTTCFLWSATLLSAQTIVGEPYQSNWGLLGKKKTEVIPQIYDEIFEVEHDPGHYVVRKGEEFGLANAEGVFLIPVEYRDINKYHSVFEFDGNAHFPTNKALVLKNRAGKVGVVQNYKVALAFDYDAVVVIQSEVPLNPDKENSVYENQISSVYVEKNGEVRLYDWESKTLGGKVLGNALLGSGWGETAIVFQKDKFVFMQQDKVVKVSVTPEENPALIVTRVFMKGRVGLLNKNAIIVVPVIYDDIVEYDLTKNHICASKAGKYGVVELRGKPIIPFKYEHSDMLTDCNDYPEGDGDFFLVKENGLYAITSKTGKFYAEFKYRHVYCTEQGGKKGFGAETPEGKSFFIALDGSTKQLK